LISNVLLFVKSLSSSVTLARRGLILPEIFDLKRNKERLTRMRVQAHQGHFDLDDARRMADTDRDGNVFCRERQHEAMMHWFGDARRTEVEEIEQRINDIGRGRRAGLPQIEPLPSIEDSFLAWTNEDEYLFESSIKESWKDFDDDQTGLVLASNYSFDDGQDLDPEMLEILIAQEENRHLLFEEEPAPAPVVVNANYWVD